MSTIYPAHVRPSLPSEESIKWTRPIRSDALGAFGQGAVTLLATRGMNHIVKRFDYGSASVLESEANDPNGLDYTLRVNIPYPHPLARQVIVGITYYAHDKPPSGQTLTTPSIRLKLLTGAGVKVDPPPGPDEWAIEATTDNGYIPSGGFEDGRGRREYKLRSMYCAFPAGGASIFPTGPRRLNYGSKMTEPLVLTIRAISARVLDVTVLEAPRVVVEQ